MDWMLLGWRAEPEALVLSATAAPITAEFRVPVGEERRVRVASDRVELTVARMTLCMAGRHGGTVWLPDLLMAPGRDAVSEIWRALTGDEPPGYSPACPLHPTTLMVGGPPSWTCETCADEAGAEHLAPVEADHAA